MDFQQILMAAATQAGGAAAPPDPYGPELITNGDFSSSDDWTLSAGVTISTGKLRFTNVTNNGAKYMPVAPYLTEGLTYHVVFTIDSISEGALAIEVGTESFGTERSTPGTFTQDIVAGFDEGDGILAYFKVAAETTCVIDNLSVKLVL